MNHQKDIYHLYLASDLYRLLALAFDAPSKQQFETIETLLDDIGHEVHQPDIAQCLQDLQRAAKAESATVEAEYNRLFVNQVLCPPCEGSYHLAERGPILGDITAFYRAFSLETVEQQGPPDSIRMELGYMSFMALKRISALEGRDDDAADITKVATMRFLMDHLGRWGFLFADRLLASTTHMFYQTSAKLLKVWFECEMKFYDLSPHPLPLKLLSFEDEESVQCHL
ncbi:MAG: hypothetical protein A3I05_09135 [Deltaproteobacteria bacterium RIFCSPLOWO2_02_FULL_44_10]|nr:MAG: hypothetical protein A3C46_08480 [Deltaproteobacteria bacterium RIFCSPHIGHO2_02_FULL_44_16]OGQ45266.1 MAG: hypothetical protein A3I05_09135 [Deltaproteobacteria bacterium RIFCSPLOWO2_02_FULL_44_10]